MATSGLVAPFMTCFDSGGNTRLIRGMFEEVVDRMCAYGGAIQPSEIPTASAFTSYIANGHMFHYGLFFYPIRVAHFILQSIK